MDLGIQVERCRRVAVDQTGGLAAFKVINESVGGMNGNIRHVSMLSWMIVEVRGSKL